IVDDIFNIDRERMHSILNLIIDSQLEIKIAFPNGLRADILSQGDILLLKKAGAYMLTFSIETSSKRLQKLTKKNLNLKKVIKNIEYANSIGLITKGYIMIGFPTETITEIKNTINFAINSGLNMASFFAVIPFKGTGLFELTNKQYKATPEAHAVHFFEESFYEKATGFKLANIQKKAYIEFYTLKRLLTLFLKAPSKFQFLLWFFRQVYYGKIMVKIEYEIKKKCLFKK
ncbi:MAG: radical SAM protein, partial [Candidatus Omnitrophica bacterium]|nr:radical SAM protein [Candidatus Omnitrophota bacterium]